mgnify:CR=1 FL=1
MKKLFVYSALVLCGTALSVVWFNTLKDNVKEDIVSSTNDFMNEKKGINKINVKKASKSSTKFNSSKIYVQTATDEEGYDYLRFATAIKGNFTNVSYTRHIDGLTDKSDIVTTLYKGITANNEDNFFNGAKLLNKNVTSTSDYYWACYTIKFVTDTYKDSDISITFKVDDYEASRTTSLNTIKYDLNDETLFDKVNDSYDIVTLGDKITANGYGYIQGLCNDNESLYYTLSERNRTTNIVKRNIKTGVEEVIASNIKLSDTTPDAGHIRLINNKFYILTNEHKLVCYDLSTNAVIDNDLVFEGLEGTLLDFDFIESMNQFATLNTNGLIQFYGLDMKVVSTIQSAAVSGYKLKSFRFDKEHIYVASNKNDEKTIAINIYDYAGNIVSTYKVTNSEFLSSCSANYNISNFLFFNSKLYICALTWTGNYSGLYELNYKANNILENDWEDYYDYAKLEGGSVDYNFDTITDSFSVNSKGNVQGVCTDYSGSRYAYYAFNDSNNNKGVIIKYDFVKNKVVGYSKEYVVCDTGKWTGDNANIFYYEGRIFIIKTDGTFASVNASDITGNGVGEVNSSDESLKFRNASNETLTGITSVVYSNVEEKFAVIASGNLYIYSKDLKQLNTGNELSIGNTQTLYVDGNKLYFVSGEGKGSYQETTTDSEETSTTTTYQYNYINIVKLNWNGTKSGNTITLGDKTNPIGDIYEQTAAKRNVQNMVVVDGNLYVATLSWAWINNKANGTMIHKFNVKNADALTSNKDLVLGEYVEMNKLNNKANSFEANAYIKNDTKDGQYIQGITTDGDNLYLACTSTENKKITIVRKNLVTNESVKGTTYDLNTTGENHDAGKIFFYNNQVWVVKDRSNQVFGVNKDTLVATGDTMTFALPSGVNSFDVKYNEANELFVVYGSDGKIYMFSDENTLVNTPFSVGANKKSITINDSYIYVNSSSNNQQFLTVEAYDYDGKKVINALNLGADNICDASVSNSFNTQAFIEYKGLIIMVALGWTGANNGGHVYAITMK